MSMLKSVIFQFKGGIEGGYYYHTSKTGELDEVVGDIFHKIKGTVVESL